MLTESKVTQQMLCSGLPGSTARVYNAIMEYLTTEFNTNHMACSVAFFAALCAIMTTSGLASKNPAMV
jgi:hypothetical protein